jgi:hypothetical protein
MAVADERDMFLLTGRAGVRHEMQHIRRWVHESQIYRVSSWSRHQARQVRHCSYYHRS